MKWVYNSYSTCQAYDGYKLFNASTSTKVVGQCMTNDVGTQNQAPYPSVRQYQLYASTGFAKGATGGKMGNTIYFSSDLGLNSNAALKAAYEKGYGAAVGLYDTINQQYFAGCSVTSDYTVYNRRASYQLSYYGTASASKFNDATAAAVSLSASSSTASFNTVLTASSLPTLSASVTSIQVSSPTSSSGSSSGGGLSTGAIVGIVIGVIVLLVVVGVVVFFCCCKKETTAKQEETGSATAVV